MHCIRYSLFFYFKWFMDIFIVRMTISCALSFFAIHCILYTKQTIILLCSNQYSFSMKIDCFQCKIRYLYFQNAIENYYSLTFTDHATNNYNNNGNIFNFQFMLVWAKGQLSIHLWIQLNIIYCWLSFIKWIIIHTCDSNIIYWASGVMEICYLNPLHLWPKKLHKWKQIQIGYKNHNFRIVLTLIINMCWHW
jgi:hypothetical protein